MVLAGEQKVEHVARTGHLNIALIVACAECLLDFGTLFAVFVGPELRSSVAAAGILEFDFELLIGERF